MARRSMFSLLVLFAIVIPASGFAGPSSSGGGNEMVAQFVSLANGLLTNYPWAPDQKMLLGKTLQVSKIASVPVLIDADTGNPVPNQKYLVAWSSKGLIQLKDGSADSTASSWPKLVQAHTQLAQQIAHELYRATGLTGPDGKSIDDTYQLSIGVYHLDKFQLFPAIDIAPSLLLGGPDSLLGQVRNVKPNGHLIYCKDGSAASAEFLFVETTNNDYVLSIRESAYEGRTLGVILDGSIDPSFTAASTGNYLELTTHVPVVVPNPPAGPAAPTCKFTNASTGLVDCGLGTIVTGSSTLSDGLKSEVLSVAQLYPSTSIQSIQNVNGQTQKIVINYTMYSKLHPFPNGFTNSANFDPGGCTSR